MSSRGEGPVDLGPVSPEVAMRAPTAAAKL